ncbi:MAG: phosphatidylserine decarboxylase [Thermoplasmata archaeon]|nr:phosphatidylserine decarboxylase [Thermoplasmata archaeon]
MFAPGAGRPLGISAGLLVLGALLEGARVLPFSYSLLALLVLGTGFWAFFAQFFRDPERTTGDGIVSPADGVVQAVLAEGDRTRICVFMNVTDVHVNRMPVDGRFTAISDGGSGFLPAYRPDAAHNVARTYQLETSYGAIEVVQITGLVARRLVSFVHSGESLRRGERFGMIVLGSRVDVLLPRDRVTPTVRPGDRVWAGHSTIARERA